jgi:hypothetical protein
VGMTNLYRQKFTQEEQCKQLRKVLDSLIDQIGRTPITEKIVALCAIKLSDPLRLLNEAEREKWALIHKNWIIALTWILKFESKALRDEDPPFEQPIFQFLEPLGRKHHADLLLWDDCLSFTSKFGVSRALDYDTPIDGWYVTTQERMRCAYQSVFFKVTKRKMIDYKKKEVALLEKFENPVNPQEKINLYNLIEAARAIARHNPTDNNKLKRARHEFRNFRWKAYIAAHRNLCQRMNGMDEVLMHEGEKLNPLLTFVEDEKLKVMTSGRQTRTIFPI